MSFFKSIWGDYFFSFLVLIIGLTASLLIGSTYQQHWKEIQHRKFSAVASERLELIRSEIHNTDVVLRSLASLFLASEDVSHEEFQTFSQALLEDSPFIAATIWVPVVSDKDRARYEQAAKEWDKNFAIREFNDKGELVTSPQRATYLPIYYSMPQRSVTYLGFDYTTEPARRAALDLAKMTGSAAATEKISLQRDKRAGVIFTYPIFKAPPGRTGKNAEVLLGYVMTVVPMASLIDMALAPLNPEGVNIVIHDKSAATPENKILYTKSTSLSSISEEEILADYNSEEQLSETALINVNGRLWDVTVQAARGYFENSIQRPTYAILAAGVSFSLMLFVFMFTRVRENERIGQRVFDRTRELQQAKNKIETILFSTNDGVIGLDKGAVITFCNPMAAKLLGYSRQWDIREQNYHALVAHSRDDGVKYNIQDSAVNKALASGETATVSDEVFWRRDGQPLQVEYTVSPIIDENEVAGAVINFRDISERRAMEKKLEQMARYDQLTGLANRMMFVDQLRKALARAKRQKKKVGVVYIDLNNFKPINDTMGHAAGDTALKIFAEKLNHAAREYDLPARLGGDEFTIMVDNLENADGCIKLVDRLLENLKESISLNGKDLNLSGSIGIAMYPDDAEDLDDLISHADAAMYRAKKDKSLTYVVYKDIA